jgi:hypothetical protein
MSFLTHIREIMEGDGFDLDEVMATSCTKVHPDGTESWYREAAILEPWSAWKAGLGEARGRSREEALARLRSMEESFAKPAG